MEKEGNITLTGTGSREDQKLTHCIEVVPWSDKISEKCLKSRQWVLVLGKASDSPRAEWESRGSEQKQTTGVKMTFYKAEDYMTYHCCVKVYKCWRLVQINRKLDNWISLNQNSKQAARTPAVTWMIPTDPGSFSSLPAPPI